MFREGIQENVDWTQRLLIFFPNLHKRQSVFLIDCGPSEDTLLVKSFVAVQFTLFH